MVAKKREKKAGCERRPPRARVRLHLPANIFHRHIDRTFEVAGETDWQLWVSLMRDLLLHMGYSQPGIVVGFWLDALNALPEDMRKALVIGIAAGYGLSVEEHPEERAVEVRHVSRYTPLVGDLETPGGLVIPRPQKTAGGLVLP